MILLSPYRIWRNNSSKGLPIGNSVTVAITDLPKGYSLIIVLIQCRPQKVTVTLKS